MFFSSKCIKRCSANPILSAEDIPYDASLVFNAGVVKYQGRYVMVFRNDYGNEKATFSWDKFRTNIGVAFSDDGINWDVCKKPWIDINDKTSEIQRFYDPRLSVIDGKCYLCFAVDTKHGIRGGIAVTEDFDNYEILSMSVPDNRNMVLFPEKINGNFFRLERPFPVYGRPRDNEMFDIWISQSPDCVYWGKTDLLLATEQVGFANAKIGPAAPPILTEAGWLTTFHATLNVDADLPAWHSDWRKKYYAGLMLLDKDNPGKIIGMSSEPLIVPETDYELDGFRGSVIFPGGMILEDSGEVKIYYGAADTVECLASAHVNDLLKTCGQ